MRPENIVTSPLADIELPKNANLFQYVCGKFSDYGENPAIVSLFHAIKCCLIKYK